MYCAIILGTHAQRGSLGSMELGPEDVSLLDHFRGCSVQASMELPEDVSLLERCPPFRGCYVQA